jgi:hypothetical protein
MTFAFRWEELAPHAPTEAGADGTRADNGPIWSIIVPTDGTNAAQSDKRKFPYFLAFAAASGPVIDLPTVVLARAETQKHNSKLGNKFVIRPRVCRKVRNRMRFWAGSTLNVLLRLRKAFNVPLDVTAFQRELRLK